MDNWANEDLKWDQIPGFKKRSLMLMALENRRKEAPEKVGNFHFSTMQAVVRVRAEMGMSRIQTMSPKMLLLQYWWWWCCAISHIRLSVTH